jgi:hypothetical protein
MWIAGLLKYILIYCVSFVHLILVGIQYAIRRLVISTISQYLCSGE